MFTQKFFIHRVNLSCIIFFCCLIKYYTGTNLIIIIIYWIFCENIICLTFNFINFDLVHYNKLVNSIFIFGQITQTLVQVGYFLFVTPVDLEEYWSIPADVVNAEVGLTPVYEVVIESDTPCQLFFRPTGLLQNLESEHSSRPDD